MANGEPLVGDVAHMSQQPMADHFEEQSSNLSTYRFESNAELASRRDGFNVRHERQIAQIETCV